jgi:hypothetical protein
VLALALLLLLLLPLAASGCESRVLTEADCMRVRDRIREAWRRDAVAALRDANTDAFRRYVQDEARRMGDRFMIQCSERVGLTVDAAELACMEKVDSIDEVYACAGR